MFQVAFLGDGPLGQMTAISADGGYVKGFVGNPLCDPVYNENGKVRLLCNRIANHHDKLL